MLSPPRNQSATRALREVGEVPVFILARFGHLGDEEDKDEKQNDENIDPDLVHSVALLPRCRTGGSASKRTRRTRLGSGS